MFRMSASSKGDISQRRPAFSAVLSIINGHPPFLNLVPENMNFNTRAGVWGPGRPRLGSLQTALRVFRRLQVLCEPGPPNVPQLRALWSLLDGIWGVLKGSWGGAESSNDSAKPWAGMPQAL